MTTQPWSHEAQRSPHGTQGSNTEVRREKFWLFSQVNSFFPSRSKQRIRLRQWRRRKNQMKAAGKGEEDTWKQMQD